MSRASEMLDHGDVCIETKKGAQNVLGDSSKGVITGTRHAEKDRVESDQVDEAEREGGPTLE